MIFQLFLFDLARHRPPICTARGARKTHVNSHVDDFVIQIQETPRRRKRSVNCVGVAVVVGVLYGRLVVTLSRREVVVVVVDLLRRRRQRAVIIAAGSGATNRTLAVVIGRHEQVFDTRAVARRRQRRHRFRSDSRVAPTDSTPACTASGVDFTRRTGRPRSCVNNLS